VSKKNIATIVSEARSAERALQHLLEKGFLGVSKTFLGLKLRLRVIKQTFALPFAIARVANPLKKQESPFPSRVYIVELNYRL